MSRRIAIATTEYLDLDPLDLDPKIQDIIASPQFHIYLTAPIHQPGDPNPIQSNLHSAICTPQPTQPLYATADAPSQLIAAFSAVGAFAYFLTSTRPLRPVAAREYPYGGLEKELGGHNAARAESEEVDE
jgi:hypothetical protein